jgi:hypothetical protein
MNKIILTLTVGGFLLYGCGNTSNEKTKEHTETHQDYQHDDEQSTIRLNNGEKWLVNEEMKPFILEAENILKEYISKKSTDYKALAEQLKKKNSGLIKSCTMKGESHDELHNWLHPHIDLIKALSEATSDEDAASIVSELENSFKTYHNYFQ